MKHLKRFNESVNKNDKKLTLDDIKNNLDIYNKVSKKYPIISDPQNKIIKDAGLHWESHKLTISQYINIDDIKKINIDKDQLLDKFFEMEDVPSWMVKDKKKFENSFNFDEILSVNWGLFEGGKDLYNYIISFLINNPDSYDKIPLQFQKVDMTAEEIISKIDKTINSENILNDIKSKILTHLENDELNSDQVQDMLMEIRYELMDKSRKN